MKDIAFFILIFSSFIFSLAILREHLGKETTLRIDNVTLIQIGFCFIGISGILYQLNDIYILLKTIQL